MKKGVHKKPYKAAKVISNKDVLQAVIFLTENTVNKEDLAYLKSVMATRKHIEAMKDDIDILGEEIDTVQNQIYVIQTHVERTSTEVVAIRVDMATKEYVQTAKDEIIQRFIPLEQAFERDSEMLIDHERRITSIEKQLA